MGRWGGGESREGGGGGGHGRGAGGGGGRGRGAGGWGGVSRFVSRCFGFNVVSTAQGHLSTTKHSHT